MWPWGARRVPTQEELEILERKLTTLKLAYDQYFLGSRPREPSRLRDEVRKLVVTFSNQAIQNTALRFKFNSIVSRYQAFNRQWTDTLRKIESGTYERHRFKAKLHEKGSGPVVPDENPGVPQSRDAIYEAYLEARRACGQSVDQLSPSKLNSVLDKQEKALRSQYGSDSQIQFRVVVEAGRAKLKAARI